MEESEEEDYILLQDYHAVRGKALFYDREYAQEKSVTSSAEGAGSFQAGLAT